MLKRKLLCCLFLICLIVTSCNSRDIVGIENYHPSLGSIGVCDYLPTESFLEDYTYNNADFFFSQNSTFSSWETQKSLLCLDYKQSTYTQAKEVIIKESLFSKQNRYNYNNYIFIESLQRVPKDALNNNGENKNFPCKSWDDVVVADFTLFFYNDVENMLGSCTLPSHNRRFIYPYH